MGYAKYHEDDSDAISDRLYSLRSPSIPKEQEPVFDCSYCSKTFRTQEDCYAHIKTDHNIVKPLIFVNSRIAEGLNYVTSVESLTVVLYGDSNIVLDGQTVERAGKEEVDITNLVAGKKNNFTITIGEHSTEIRFYSRESITNPAVIAFVDEWADAAEKDKPLIRKPYGALNSGEQKFLDGFYNYFIACSATGEDKVARYEDAYSILSAFMPSTAIVACVLKVIAFRLNWIEKLIKLSRANDDFRCACDFYLESISGDGKNITGSSEGIKSLFVENDVEECLSAIGAWQLGRFAEVENYLAKFVGLPLAIEDSNLRDRIFLMMARNENRKKNTLAAISYYEEVKSPYFRVECDNFIKNHRR